MPGSNIFFFVNYETVILGNIYRFIEIDNDKKAVRRLPDLNNVSSFIVGITYQDFYVGFKSANATIWFNCRIMI